MNPLSTIPTNAARGQVAIARSMHEAVVERLRDAAAVGIAPEGVGIASAGAIDSAAGKVFAATDNLPGWAGFDIRNSLPVVTELHVFVENDAHAATLAELPSVPGGSSVASLRSRLKRGLAAAWWWMDGCCGASSGSLGRLGIR